jgi:hypothetical protein
MIIIPALNQVGTSKITVRVIDAEGMFADRSFNLTVNSDRPSMHIERIGNAIILSWPSNGQNCFAETTDDLMTWQEEAQPPGSIGGQNRITVSGSAPRRFYRLRCQ